MKRGEIINIALVAAAVLLLVGFAFSVRIPPAADAVAVLRTIGMTCGGCGAGIERALLARRGVTAVELDVLGGRVVVGYDSKETGTAELASAVTGAGYPSRVEKALTVRQFRSLTGRDIGTGDSTRMGCGCAAALLRNQLR